MNKRSFILGSEWFYIKLYSGPKTLEHIFVNEIYPKIAQLVENELIDYFFFIRYADPDYHIRLRLHLRNKNNIGEVILFLYTILENHFLNHTITKITIDTYKREIERYGNNYIEDIEKAFYFDSLFMLNYFTKYEEDDENRWLVSVKYIDSFLTQCGFLLKEKIEFCKNMSAAYSKEIYLDAKYVNKQISEKFKKNRKTIALIIENSKTKHDDWMEDLNIYLNQIVFFTRKIKSTEGGKVSQEIFPLLSSIIHMHVNRMFRTKQRINECVIYNLLCKYFTSKSMIEKNNIGITSLIK